MKTTDERRQKVKAACEKARAAVSKLSSDERQKLESAARQIIASGKPEPRWQPIESAPRDGTAILTADAQKRVITGWWQQDLWHTGWVAGGHRSDVDEIEPTHWMPLPQPPTE